MPCIVQLQFNVSLCLRKVIGIQEALNVNAVSDGAVGLELQNGVWLLHSNRDLQTVSFFIPF